MRGQIGRLSAMVKYGIGYYSTKMMHDDVSLLLTQLARAEAVLSLLIESTCGGEVSTPNDAMRAAKPLAWHESDGELSVMVVYNDGTLEFGEAIQACERGAVAEQRMWCIVPRGNERYSAKATADLQEDEWSVFDANPADLPNPYPEAQP